MPVRRSVLLVPVPDAAAVDPWRERTCGAKPSGGIPPHVTLVFPFIPALEIDDEVIAVLSGVFADVDRFPFELGQTGRFEHALYLEPEPASPFVAATEAIVASFPAYPPYGGEHAEIVPHLTVAMGDDDVLAAAVSDVQPLLPIRTEACDVMLLAETEPDSQRWQLRARFPLRG